MFDLVPTEESPNRVLHDLWKVHAVCRDIPDATELFFSDDFIKIVKAKSICAECPVLAQCLESALARQEPCGVWGGQIFVGGKVLAVKRRRGRPPKVPRPEDRMPMVPIPPHLLKATQQMTA